MIILALTFVLYGNSISNEYAMDDEIVVLNNPLVEKGIKGIPEIFQTHFSKSKKVQYGYRPLVATTFAVEYQFLGNSNHAAHFSHFINVLIYAATMILIFLIIRITLPIHWSWQSLILLLFLFHPIHSEVVNNLKSRDELLSVFCGFATMLCAIRYLDYNKWKWLVLGMVFFFLGMLSKLTVLIFVVIIPLTLFYFRGMNWKKGLFILSIFIVAVILFRITKKSLLLEPGGREFLYFENPLFFNSGLNDRVLFYFQTLGNYLKLLIWPHPLSFYYGYSHIPIPDWGNLMVWFSALFHSFLGIIALKGMKTKTILSFGIWLWLISISAYGNLLAPVVGIVGERFAYVASLGFVVVFVWTMNALISGKKFKPNFNKIVPKGMVMIVSLLLLFSAFKIVKRNPVWKDHLTLYRHDIKHLDNSAKAHVLLAGTIYPTLFNMPEGPEKQKLIKESLNHFKKGIELYEGYHVAWNNIGTIYFTFYGDYNKAIPYFSKAIELKPDYVEAYFNLGYSYERIGKFAIAKEMLFKAIENKPSYINAYSKLLGMYSRDNEWDKMKTLCEYGVAKNPESGHFYMNLANYYSLQKDTVNALNNFIYSANFLPENTSEEMSHKKKLYFHISAVFNQLALLDSANIYAEKAKKLP